MASVLLLYYHLLIEGGITHDQTVYLDPDHFDGFTYLDVTVDSVHADDIDERLLREGAVLYLLCDLNDIVAEYEDDYLSQPLTFRILSAYDAGMMSHVQGVEPLIRCVRKPMKGAEDFEQYQAVLQRIYDRYVVDRFKALVRAG